MCVNNWVLLDNPATLISKRLTLRIHSPARRDVNHGSTCFTRLHLVSVPYGHRLNGGNATLNHN